MTQSESQKIAKKSADLHKDKKKRWVTSDGQCFQKEHDAIAHARDLKESKFFEVEVQKAESGKQEAGGGKQKAEDEEQKAEDEEQKDEGAKSKKKK